MTLLSCGSNYNALKLTSADQLMWNYVGGGGSTLAPVLRDPTAWMHLVVSLDTTNATAGLRLRIWFNNVAITVSAPVQNQVFDWFYNATVYLGYRGVDSPYDGYLSEVNFIDGIAALPTAFGQTDPITGQWTAKRYSGTYGTNGFYLPFTDTTSATTLCYDASGNGNNWTPTNISTTAGATYDSMLDVPLAYGTTDRGNYCTLSPIAKAYAQPTFSNGNLTATALGSDWYGATGTVGVTSGKWYWEVGTNNSDSYVGIRGDNHNLAPQNPQIGSGTIVYYYDGTKRVDGTFTSYGSSWSGGDNIAIALDMDARTIVFYKNGVAQPSISLSVSTLNNYAVFPMVVGYNSGNIFTVNFGQRPFAYTPPTGFKALHTGNMPAVTGAALEPRKHFDVAIRTGDGTDGKEIYVDGRGNDLLFNPDFVWDKTRGVANWHQLFDSVRGVGKRLFSNDTGAESSAGQSLSAFSVTAPSKYGFTIDDDAGSADLNGSGETHVNWLWKAGGSPVSNTNGTITSQVSANVDAGFSIVTYTGTGAVSETIGHGLGVAPKMVISKSRTGIGAWVLSLDYSGFTWSSDYFQFDTNAKRTNGASTVWRQAPTSSVFTVGATFGNGIPYVAYCFAEIAGYSKIGSYVGNGSADGPMVVCNFKPRWVLIKRSDSTSSWAMFDTARNTYNVVNSAVIADGSGSEYTITNSDFLSGGFKLRSSDSAYNASGGTYIYIAIADAPFKHSLAR